MSNMQAAMRIAVCPRGVRERNLPFSRLDLNGNFDRLIDMSLLLFPEFTILGQADLYI